MDSSVKYVLRIINPLKREKRQNRYDSCPDWRMNNVRVCSDYIFNAFFDESERVKYPCAPIKYILVPFIAPEEWYEHQKKLVRFMEDILVEYGFAEENRMPMIALIKHARPPKDEECFCRGYWCRDRQGLELSSFAELIEMIKAIHLKWYPASAKPAVLE